MRADVKSSQQQKWRQINKYVETLDALFEETGFTTDKKIEIADMGSGKGYLTFAAYDFLRNSKGLDVAVTGIDANPTLTPKVYRDR